MTSRPCFGDRLKSHNKKQVLVLHSLPNEMKSEKAKSLRHYNASSQTVVTSTSSSASVTLSQPPLTSLQSALICSSTMSTFHFCPVFEQRRPILSRPMKKKKEKKKRANHSRSSRPVDGGLIVIAQAVMSKPLTSPHEELK